MDFGKNEFTLGTGVGLLGAAFAGPAGLLIGAGIGAVAADGVMGGTAFDLEDGPE
jgi:hypothetical protein